jgi:aryl-alcohol dehydrogenase-like predicted oxidoreductase
MEMRTLGKNGPRVSAMGLGCMRMSSLAGPKSSTDEEGIATIQAALDSGINFLNTGDFYGMGHNELLVGKAIKGRRDQALISVKFGALRSPSGQMLGIDVTNSATRVKLKSSPNAMFSAPTASTNNLNDRVLKMDAVWAGSRAGGAFTYGFFCWWDVAFEGWRD